MKIPDEANVMTFQVALAITSVQLRRGDRKMALSWLSQIARQANAKQGHDLLEIADIIRGGHIETAALALDQIVHLIGGDLLSDARIAAERIENQTNDDRADRN